MFVKSTYCGYPKCKYLPCSVTVSLRKYNVISVDEKLLSPFLERDWWSLAFQLDCLHVLGNVLF